MRVENEAPAAQVEDAAASDEDGQLPKGGLALVVDPAAHQAVAGKEVDPDSLLVGQVDPVADA